MKPWVVLYEENKRKSEIDKKDVRGLNSRNMPYIDHLKEKVPLICPNNLVHDQVREKYGIFSHYSHG